MNLYNQRIVNGLRKVQGQCVYLLSIVFIGILLSAIGNQYTLSQLLFPPCIILMICVFFIDTFLDGYINTKE